jgi:hypothetical protein
MSLSISVDPDLVEGGLERAIEPQNTPDRFFFSQVCIMHVISAAYKTMFRGLLEENIIPMQQRFGALGAGNCISYQIAPQN